MNNVGRARNWPLWAGDRFTEVTVKAGLTVEVPREVQERMVSTLDQMQVPNGTGPGVRRSKRP